MEGTVKKISVDILDDKKRHQVQPQRTREHAKSTNCRMMTLLMPCIILMTLYSIYHVTARINELERRIDNIQLPSRCRPTSNTKTSSPYPTTTTTTTNRPTTSTPASATTQQRAEVENNTVWKSTAVTPAGGAQQLPAAGPSDDEDYVDYSDTGSGSGIDSWFDESYVRRRRSADASAAADDDVDEEEDEMMSDEPADNRRSRATTSESPVTQRPKKGRRSSTSRPAETANCQTQCSAIKAAHFHAVGGPDKQFNSHARPPVTFSFWRTDRSSNNQSFFVLNRDTGIVTILESGLYMIYSQIVYHDLAGRWSYGIFVNDSERIKCLNTEQLQQQHQVAPSASSSQASHGVYQQCYTSAVQKLQRFEQVSIRCLYGSRTILVHSQFTFWGIVKLAG